MRIPQVIPYRFRSISISGSSPEENRQKAPAVAQTCVPADATLQVTTSRKQVVNYLRNPEASPLLRRGLAERHEGGASSGRQQVRPQLQVRLGQETAGRGTWTGVDPVRRPRSLRSGVVERPYTGSITTGDQVRGIGTPQTNEKQHIGGCHYPTTLKELKQFDGRYYHSFESTSKSPGLGYPPTKVYRLVTSRYNSPQLSPIPTSTLRRISRAG